MREKLILLLDTRIFCISSVEKRMHNIDMPYDVKKLTFIITL